MTAAPTTCGPDGARLEGRRAVAGGPGVAGPEARARAATGRSGPPAGAP